ncbi:MAG: hypothetical protein AAF992_07935 [Bacteroidota bacterium]
MKKQLLLPISFLLINTSCEDPLEGNIVPFNTNIGGLETNPNTHWKFTNFSTEGKPDGNHILGTNPTSGSVIYLEVVNGVVVDAWATQPQSFTTRSQSTTTQVNQQFGFTSPIDPVHGQPIAAVLPRLNGCPHDGFCNPDPQTLNTKCITVLQPKSKRLCIPYSGAIKVYVPFSL